MKRNSESLRRALFAVALAMSTASAVPAAEVTARGNVILVPNDNTIAPFGRPFNLTGKTLTFTRTGEDSFRSTTGPLVIDDDRGAVLPLDPASLAATFTISGFDFPFFNGTRRTLHISRLLAIYLDTPPPAARFRQYSDAELLLQTTPVIAPLLTTIPGQTNFRPPSVFVREAADRVIVTWYEATRPVEIQAVLFRNGDIRFSYRSIGNTRGGAVLITSGNEAWRAPTVIGSGSDPAGDFTTGNPPEIAAMLDITSVTATRIGGTNVLQFIIRVRRPIDRSALGSSGFIGIHIRAGAQAFLSAQISASGTTQDSLSSREYAVTGPASLMRVEGDTITLTISQEHLLGDSRSDGQLVFGIANPLGGDTATIAGTIEAPVTPARTDFGASAERPASSGPISDAFTIPNSNALSVWEKARATFDLDPSEVDGFVVYQNFQTAGVPVASVGNAGVDNISIGSSLSSALAREPNVIDMHTIGDLWNATDDNAMQVLLHEWGHRWLFFIEHLENGLATRILNDGGHPALHVDTRAAFPVRASYDCSVMGGSTYTDHGNGMFSGPPDTCGAGYSWLELYLMGFAAPEEVPEFFYLTDTDPPLDELGFVEQQTFRAIRKNVRVEDVVARLGLRRPLYPATQRKFRVLFALVYDPDRPLPAEDIEVVARYAQLFRERFSRAVGGRGSVDSSLATPRRRAVRP